MIPNSSRSNFELESSICSRNFTKGYLSWVRELLESPLHHSLALILEVVANGVQPYCGKGVPIDVLLSIVVWYSYSPHFCQFFLKLQWASFLVKCIIVHFLFHSHVSFFTYLSMYLFV